MKNNSILSFLETYGLSRVVPVVILGAGLTLALVAVGSGDRSEVEVSNQETTSSEVSESVASGEDVQMAQASSSSIQSSFDDTQRQAIENIVREYLLKNPEILLEAQTELEQKMEIARTEQMKTAIAENAKAIFQSPVVPVHGNPNGDVTVVEFFDYNCGFCKRALSSVVKLVDTDQNVKVVFKEFPIFGKDSEDAARVAIAAGKQGKYWEMHRALFETPGKSNKAKGLRLAEKLGLDLDKLKADMTAESTNEELASVQKLAEVMGIRGTPHFFVGEKVIPGAPEDLYEQLASRVTDVRATGCAVC